MLINNKAPTYQQCETMRYLYFIVTLETFAFTEETNSLLLSNSTFGMK